MKRNAMTASDKKKLLRENAYLWIAAMVIAPIFDLGFRAFASGPVKFPWVILTPLLIVGLFIASNKLLSKAIGETTDDASGTEATH
jgi:hypothetical protein